MIDRPSAIALLEYLHKQIPSLHTKPRLGEEFNKWRNEVFDALEKIFGSGSNELIEFQRIHFEIRPEILSQSRERIHTFLRERFDTDLQYDFEVPHDHYYQQRLYEASEFLLALIVMLRLRAR